MEVKGLNEKNINDISDFKNEDKWVKDFRIKSYHHFCDAKLPNFGPNIELNFDDIIYYKGSNDELKSNWSSVSCNIKNEFDNLGVISSEKVVDGTSVQYESDVIYHNMIDELNSKNIIFTSIDDALKKYPDLVKKYFGKIVSNCDNKFASLNGAVFSGGSFIYIPPNTTLDRPLQSYFRISSKNMGQFERTLIIVDDDSSLHYIEGCTATTYTESSLHAAVVEIYVGKRSKCRYSTVQNWANNVYNLVTKRALVEENGTMEWIDGNIGSYKTMKYPACILKGNYAKGVCLTISMASTDQEQDTGAKMIHIGKNTTSKIISKSISTKGGNATYRGIVDIKESAIESESLVKCDSLILDEISKTDTIQKNIVSNSSSSIEHEAVVSKISYDKLFYLMSRGLDEEKAINMIILGFLDEFKKELPLEYAVELNQLIKKNM